MSGLSGFESLPDFTLPTVTIPPEPVTTVQTPTTPEPATTVVETQTVPTAPTEPLATETVPRPPTIATTTTSAAAETVAAEPQAPEEGDTPWGWIALAIVLGALGIGLGIATWWRRRGGA